MSKEVFIKLYKENIKRPGADELLSWLEQSDFFSAPASTKFHGNCEGGLCTHSIMVYYRLRELYERYCTTGADGELFKASDETIAIVSLLHDVCKVGCYKVDYRNAKNEFGVWEKVPYYKFDEQFSYGYHGPKSVYLIERYLKLSEIEAVAIANHMSAFDRNGGDYSLADVYSSNPLALFVSFADQMASYINNC